MIDIIDLKALSRNQASKIIDRSSSLENGKNAAYPSNMKNQDYINQIEMRSPLSASRDGRIGSRNFEQKTSLGNKDKPTSLQHTSAVNLPSRHQLNHSVELTKNEIDEVQNDGTEYGVNATTTRNGALNNKKQDQFEMRQRLSKSSFEATVLPEIGPNTSTVGVDRKVRALPLHNTEDVFNEWGALLRHQDEIDIKIQKENYEKMKLRQQNYKAELDKQYQQLVNRRKGVHGDYVKKEEENLKFQEKTKEQRARQEEASKMKIKNEQKLDAIAGYTELQIKRQQDERMRELEREMNRERKQLEKKKLKMR